MFRPFFTLDKIIVHIIRKWIVHDFGHTIQLNSSFKPFFLATSSIWKAVNGKLSIVPDLNSTLLHRQGVFLWFVNTRCFLLNIFSIYFQCLKHTLIKHFCNTDRFLEDFLVCGEEWKLILTKIYIYMIFVYD